MNIEASVPRAAVASGGGKYIKRYLILCMWFMAGTVYVHMVFQWISIKSTDKQFAESMHHAVQLAATENLATKELRALLLVRAEAFSIPIHGEEIMITGSGTSLRAALHYDAHISLPFLNKAVYRMSFDHDVRFRPPSL
jgi:hypothetical protein